MPETTTPEPAALREPSGSEPVPRTHEEWVLPDRRVLGLDKRTLGPGIALLVIWFIWAHVTPFINEQIELDNPVVAGDVMNLGDGELTFVPAVGWNVESGQRVTDQVVQPPPQTVELSSDLVVYVAKSAPWDGTAEEKLDRMIDINDRKGVLLANDQRGRREHRERRQHPRTACLGGRQRRRRAPRDLRLRNLGGPHRRRDRSDRIARRHP